MWGNFKLSKQALEQFFCSSISIPYPDYGCVETILSQPKVYLMVNFGKLSNSIIALSELCYNEN